MVFRANTRSEISYLVNWNKKVYPIIVEQLKILNDQGVVPTLRSMYYRLLSLGVFDKGPKYADQALSEHTAKWRRNSIPELREHRHRTVLMKNTFTSENEAITDREEKRKMKNLLQLPIDCFADDTRSVVRTWGDYKPPDKFVEEGIASLLSFPKDFINKIPRWYGQQHYVEIWVEKKAMIGTIQHIIGDRQVRIVPLSGYSSVLRQFACW
jgi:hypothetical protein